MKKFFWAWLPFAVLGTVLSLLVALTVQQNFRQNANDPQIQIATDLQAKLIAGADPKTVATTTTPTDIATSLDTFAIVYDQNGKIITSTAILNGETPVFPADILPKVKAGDQRRLTWQPQPGVRIAAVVVPYGNGHVVVGRSLQEVESRESQLNLEVLAGWLAAMVLTGVVILVRP